MTNLSKTGRVELGTRWGACCLLILAVSGCGGQLPRDAIFGLGSDDGGDQLVGVAGIAGVSLSQTFLSCEISAFLGDDSPAPSPLESVLPVDVTIRSTVFWDGTPGIDEAELADAMYTWQIDGRVRAGFADTHSTQSLRLFDPGSHSISLSMVVGGVTVQCLTADTHTETLQLVATPRLRGFVTDQAGAAIADATISLTGGKNVQTDTDGIFEVYVALGWSGTVSVSHPEFSFEPLGWSLSNIVRDRTLSMVGCSNAACSDGLFCNGQETCDGTGSCYPGADPCLDTACDETLDACALVSCSTVADCPQSNGDSCSVPVCTDNSCGFVPLSSGIPCGSTYDPPTLCITPTPKSSDVAGTRDAFATAAQLGGCVCLPNPTDWWHAEQKTYTDSRQYEDAEWHRFLLDKHALDAFIQVDAFRPHRWSETATPALLRGGSFGDPVIRRAFTADAVERVRMYRPNYLCLGMEINTYYEGHPEDFDNFVSLFKETRREIKKLYPNVMVFVSFQYEELQGFNLGESVVASTEPRWELIDRFEPDQDAVGISSYPLVSWDPPRYGPPGALPEDYYQRLRNHTDKPIIFAELGWPSDPTFGGTPEAQAEFLTRFPSLIEGLDVRMVNWNFLYDAKGFGPVFESMGLFNPEGEPKPGWAALRDVSGRPR